MHMPALQRISLEHIHPSGFVCKVMLLNFARTATQAHQIGWQQPRYTLRNNID